MPSRVTFWDLAFVFFGFAAGAQGQIVPRTPWGDPDLQGTYTNSNEAGLPMERPADLPASGSRT